MTGVTNSQGLVYPTGTDRRCDFPEQWGDLADLLQSKVTLIQGVVNRVYPVVPAVLLEKTVLTPFSNAISPDNPTVFDRVAIDTDNMSNLSADPKVIRPTRAGWYQVVAYAETTGTGDASNWVQFNLTGIGSGVTNMNSIFSTTFVADNGDNWQKQMSLTGFLAWDPDQGAPQSIGCEVTYGGGPSGSGTNVGYVSMGAFWWSDLP